MEQLCSLVNVPILRLDQKSPLLVRTLHSPDYNSHYFRHTDHYNPKSLNLNTLKGYNCFEPPWYKVTELRNKTPQLPLVVDFLPFPLNPLKV